MQSNDEQEEQPNPERLRMELQHLAEKDSPKLIMAEKILRQCADCCRNKRILQHYAAEQELKLTERTIDKKVQLFYDVQKDGADWGFVSRGWDEPGFRLGQTISVSDDKLTELWQQAEKIAGKLATNGIAFTIVPDEEVDAHNLCLTFNIYDTGFNPSTLLQSLQVMFDCVQQIRRTIPCE